MSAERHAVTVDGIPLIGIAAAETEERCDVCGETAFLTEIAHIGTQWECKRCRVRGWLRKIPLAFAPGMEPRTN